MLFATCHISKFLKFLKFLLCDKDGPITADIIIRLNKKWNIYFQKIHTFFSTISHTYTLNHLYVHSWIYKWSTYGITALNAF